MQFDDTGLIPRENVWLDYPTITAQLTDDPPINLTHTDQERGTEQ
jgi:hypothetical protein